MDKLKNILRFWTEEPDNERWRVIRRILGPLDTVEEVDAVREELCRLLEENPNDGELLAYGEGLLMLRGALAETQNKE